MIYQDNMGAYFTDLILDRQIRKPHVQKNADTKIPVASCNPLLINLYSLFTPHKYYIVPQ